MILPRRSLFAALLLLWLVTACTSVPTSPASDAFKAGEVCISGGIHLYTDFPAAKVDACTPIEGGFELTILPEATPINPSPWYAFRLESEAPQPVDVLLSYPGFKHRYAPKVSQDGNHWTRVPERSVRISEDKSKAMLSFNLPGKPLYVAAQKLVTEETYREWIQNLVETHPAPDLHADILGKSVQGRSILKIEAPATGNAPRGTLVLVGRQHPPEVSGAAALFAFVDELLGASPLARRFRNDYNITIIPLLNPDGVEMGNWRLNANGIDLNRDWGPFTQPETQLMRDELVRIDARDELALFLDFHSTFKNVIYTQTDDAPTNPRAFAGNWIAAMNARDARIGMTRQGGHNTDRPTSKAYVYKTYGTAAITFEMDDEIDTQHAWDFSQMAAREMMTLLLNSHERPDE